MKIKLCNYFIYSAAVLLLATALAKFISSLSHDNVLQSLDPILAISFQELFLLVGIVELVVSFICLYYTRLEFRAGLIAWLASVFLFYRLGLWFVDWQRPCPCLGNLTGVLRIPPQTADTAMKIILAYLLIGSYGTLFWLWRQRQKAISVPAPN